MVRLVSRLVVAQAVAAAVVGLSFGRRHLPSVFITLTVVAAVCLVALLARTGTRAAWLAVLTFETLFFLLGLARFVSARYLGGTLFALVTAITMIHPAVPRAYRVFPGGLAARDAADIGLGDAAGEAFGERAAG
jgi:O-antigen ligase